MGIRMRMGPSIPPHGHGGEARWRWDGWRRHHDSRASQRLWGQDPPQKGPAAGAVQRARAVQAVTASLLCREQHEAGFKADRLKLFF